MSSPIAVGAARDVSLLDIVELDMGYTTITDQYYRAVAPQRVLDGARAGIVAYLQQHGVARPAVAALRARPDGRGVVPAIERELGQTIERYGDRVVPRELVYSAISGELRALHDPYSIFLRKADLHGFTAALDGTPFGGVGIVLAQAADGRFRVDQVFDRGPAARAGIDVGDSIDAVDARPTRGLSSAAATALLRGAVGTVVRLDITRAGAAPQTIAIVRATILPPDVNERMLPNATAYIALRTFGPTAGQQVHHALAQLRARGARATVFDLRGNGGGYETSAVAVASAFISSGAIVVTQSKAGQRRTTLADGSALAPQPLVVLVDGESASASELVTGALVDHRLAKVVGTRTFGKGLVQTMYALPDGSAMKVTTARYFTPAGHDIDRVGITPDVVVAGPVDALRGVPGHDPQLDAALALIAPVPPAATPATSAAPHRQATYR